MPKKSLSRRVFLKATGASVAAATLGGTSKFGAIAQGSWDQEAEVVILGSGAAGAAAAIAGAQAGASVIVLERSQNPGGSSRRAGGVLYFGGGTSVQKKHGFNDTPDNMFNYLSAAMGEGASDELIRAFSEGSVDTFNWLTSLGVPFNDTYVPGKVVLPDTDDCLYHSGSEAAYPYTELAEPIPRGHKVQGEGSSAHVMMSVLQENATGAGVQFVYEARAERLIVEDGRVVGVEANIAGESTRVRATRGVIISTGGFQFNEELVRLYCPHYTKTAAPLGVPEEDGDGLRLGQTVGAAAMNLGHGSPWKFAYPPGEMLRSIIVNQQGRRFINEDVYGGNISDATVRNHNSIAFLIYDDRVRSQVGQHAENLSPMAQADTLEELAQQLEIPVATLVNTFQLYNEHAAEGEDIVFHKKSQYVQPLDTPPYYALDYSGESGGMVWITLGGLRIDTSGRVLDAYGNAISGLYAAGRAASGIMGYFYNSGTSLGDCVFFGRTAGRTAAQAEAMAVHRKWAVGAI